MSEPNSLRCSEFNPAGRDGRLFCTVRESRRWYSRSADNKGKRVSKTCSGLKFPQGGGVCTRGGGLTTQSNGGEQQFVARSHNYTSKRSRRYASNQWPLPFRGAATLLMSGCRLCAFFFVCLCRASGNDHCAGVARGGRGRLLLPLPLVPLKSSDLQTSDPPRALCLFNRALSPAGTGASLPQNPAAEVLADKQTQVG